MKENNLMITIHICFRHGACVNDRTIGNRKDRQPVPARSDRTGRRVYGDGRMAKQSRSRTVVERGLEVDDGFEDQKPVGGT